MTKTRDFFWRIRIGIISRTAAFKEKAIRTFQAVRRFSLRQSLRAFPSAARQFFKHTPQTLLLWTAKAKGGRLRLILLFAILSVVFGLAAMPFRFIANDGFVSFRYVAQSAAGNGFVWNPPPFEPVSGYTSFLWLVCLRILWFFGFQPPFSANLLTFSFSMGAVVFGFLFLRRAPFSPVLQSKSFFLFLLYCLILLTNPTFLMFFWSGTEAALFNFLVLWWTYTAAGKDKHPVKQSVIAVLLAMTRWDGVVFLPFTLILNILTFKHAKLKSVAAAAFLCLSYFYFDWIKQTYGSVISTSFAALRKDNLPFGFDYAGSFAVEYALWFWGIFFAAGALFKIARHRKAELAFPCLMIVLFTAYILFFSVLIGADVLAYRPLSFFVPLAALGAIRVLTAGITSRLRTVVAIVCLYVGLSLVIPITHFAEVHNLTTRRQTAFLYKPVGKPLFAFFADYWNKAQQRLIYQGAALRHKEHQVLFNELTKSLPSREKGKLLKAEYRRILAWDFAGQIGWVFPYVYILDTSGQNDRFIAASKFKYDNRRLLGHERVVAQGYPLCFGGNNLKITPFDGTPDVQYIPAPFPLTDGIIKGCEKLWNPLNSRIPVKKN